MAEISRRPSPLAPPPPKLMVPHGGRTSCGLGEKGQRLTPDSFAAQKARFQTMQPNVERFFAVVSEGHLLADTLAVTSTRSFMNQAMGRVAQDASFRNRMSELMHGSHTRWNSVRVYLPWVSIFADYVTRTPIPENLAITAIAQASEAEIRELAANHRGFFETVRQGVIAPTIDGPRLKVAGIEVIAFREDLAVTPQMIAADSSTVEHEGRTYYNGLPGDRGKFPSLIFPQGDRVSFSVRNTTTDRFYAVVPTLNGIPLRLEELSFSFEDFLVSPFPLLNLLAKTTYIKPGGEITFNSFSVERTGITRGSRDSFFTSRIGSFGFDDAVNELAHLMGAEFERQMAAETRNLLGETLSDPQDADLRAMVLHQSRYAWMHDLLKFLEGARETDLFMDKPVIADGSVSSQLNNPFLGSFGMTVIEVTRPPVVARHSFDDTTLRIAGDSLMRGGETLRGGMGAIGLASLTGGADREATRADFWEGREYDSFPHTFVGMLTANVLSTSR